MRSYEGWACRESSEQFDMLFGGAPIGRVASLYSSAADPDMIHFDPRPEGGKSAVRWNNAITAPDGTWFHWVLVFDEPANVGRLYIDGALVAAKPVPEAYSNLPGTFWIGNYPTQQAWHGMLDEVAVYERALTLEEINAHYLRGSGEAPPPAP